MSKLGALSIILCAACAGPQQPVDHKPRSYDDHVAAAAHHEEKAKLHEQAAAHAQTSPDPTAYNCGDTVLADQATSGTERLTTWMPCWDTEEEAAIEHRRLAAREHAIASHERDKAEALASAERISCQGIPARELTHTPFAHRKAIAQVIAHREGNAIHGVRVIFKPVAGLTEGYMKLAIACHQARFAALGKQPTYMPEDPSLVDGATVTVADRGGHLEVLVVTKSDVEGNVAYARAQDLLRDQTATR